MATKIVRMTAVTAASYELQFEVARITVNAVPCSISDTIDVSGVVPASFVEVHGSTTTTLDLSSQIASITLSRSSCPVTYLSMINILEQDNSLFSNSSGEIQFDFAQTLTIDTTAAMSTKYVYFRALVLGGF
jgi:hypothetical protein